MPQQLQNPLAASIAADPNKFSAQEVYDRENGRPDTSAFTQIKAAAIDPVKTPTMVQPAPYRVTYNHDGTKMD